MLGLREEGRVKRLVGMLVRGDEGRLVERVEGRLAVCELWYMDGGRSSASMKLGAILI
jgi:hypothetical protein